MVDRRSLLIRVDGDRCQYRCRPTPISVDLGNLFESVEHSLPVLREPLCLLLALAAVLSERDGRAVASLRQLVAKIVVVLGHVVITGQRTVVSDLEEPAERFSQNWQGMLDGLKKVAEAD